MTTRTPLAELNRIAYLPSKSAEELHSGCELTGRLEQEREEAMQVLLDRQRVRLHNLSSMSSRFASNSNYGYPPPPAMSAPGALHVPRSYSAPTLYRLPAPALSSPHRTLNGSDVVKEKDGIATRPASSTRSEESMSSRQFTRSEISRSVSSSKAQKAAPASMPPTRRYSSSSAINTRSPGMSSPGHNSPGYGQPEALYAYPLNLGLTSQPRLPQSSAGMLIQDRRFVNSPNVAGAKSPKKTRTHSSSQVSSPSMGSPARQELPYIAYCTPDDPYQWQHRQDPFARYKEGYR